MKNKRLWKQAAALLLAAAMALSAAACGANTASSASHAAAPSAVSGEADTAQTAAQPQAEDVPLTPSDNPYGLTDKITDGAILHCWCWSFNTIRESMQDIAYAGYSAIQTSPINECVVGADGGMQISGEGKWYYHYQPTDWTIGNYQLGTRDEFKAMCDEAHKYGVKVIVDVVPNHTTPQLDQVSQNLLDAVGGQENLYHANGFTEITNWSDRLECTTGEMGGLPDVNTENKDFQDYFIAYLNDCIACGADGFRYDTAKHIGLPDDPTDEKSEENNFWERVTTEITDADTIFNYGEVLQGDNERIEAYQEAIGATTASSYGAIVRSAVGSHSVSAATMENLQIGVESPTAVTWVESHDNYCNDGTYKTLDDDEVVLAWAIICARKSGAPLFYDRPYGATEDNMWGTMNRIGAAGDPFYKNPTVVAVNRFRNAMVGQSESFENAEDTRSVLLIGRGNKGAVAVNAGKEDYELSMSTSLADGAYTDRVTGTAQYTVENGVLTGTLPAGSAIVLYNEGYLELPSRASVAAETDSFLLIDGQTTTVTLEAENAASATYAIDGGEEVPYTSGDTVEIGAGAAAGTATTLTLRAASPDGGEPTVMTYYFTVQEQRSVTSGTTVYFTKPDTWSDTVYAYVYDERNGEVKQEALWPGLKMEPQGDGTYSYTFAEDWENALIIFSDSNKNQVPAANEPGMKVEPDKTYTIDSASTQTKMS